MTMIETPRFSKINLKLAFRTKNKKDLTLYDRFIMFATRSRYSEVELIINDKWLSFQGGRIKFKPLHQLYPCYDYVTVGEVFVSDEALYNLYKYIRKIEFKKVSSFHKIFIMFFRIPFKRGRYWFDSELVTFLLQMVGVKQVKNLDPALTLPGDLAKVFNLE